jgi:Fibronectin type III domain
MIHTRRFLGAAAVGAVGIGLLLPMEAAHAEGPCSFNTTGTTMSISTDCTLSATQPIPDGFTLDGNGHTITATGSAFSGAIFTNAAGSGSTPATMTIGHVTIDASGASGADVILFDGAKGRVNQVNITGGEPYGVAIANTAAATFAATDQVKVDNGTSIHGYQQAAVHVTDSMRFTVLRSTIGNAAGSDTAPGIFVEGLAHGAITENHINLGDAEPASATTWRAGVLIDHTLRVEVKRNIFTGTDADFGVAVRNTQNTQKTTGAVDCNLFRRNDTSATDPFGVAVGQFAPNSNTVNVQLTNATFQGNWKHNSGTVNGTTVTAGAPNTVRTPTSNCRPDAPGNVTAKGGDGQSKVTWKRANAPAWSPLTGYKVTAKTAGRPAVVKNVGLTATSTTLTGLKNGHSYKVTVTAQSNGGNANGTDTLAATKLSLSGPKAIRHGARAHLGGKLSSSDPKAKLSKRKLQLWAKPKGGKWSMIGTIKTKGGGHFDTTVKPKKKTTYKVVYGGHPGLASSHKFTVSVH